MKIVLGFSLWTIGLNKSFSSYKYLSRLPSTLLLIPNFQTREQRAKTLNAWNRRRTFSTSTSFSIPPISNGAALRLSRGWLCPDEPSKKINELFYRLLKFKTEFLPMFPSSHQWISSSNFSSKFLGLFFVFPYYFLLSYCMRDYMVVRVATTM